MKSHQYSSHFYDFLAESSGRSARAFITQIAPGLPVTSVLDVGCGQGVWLAAWLASGVTDITGLDGAYVDTASLKIPPGHFRPADLSLPFDLGRRHDLVQCLEVAEHLPPSCAETLVASLARHGDIILFSAATPGQGGEHHVNEQPLEYWAALFAALGYRAFDHVRPRIRHLREIEPWYRYNTVIYANPAGIARLAPDVLESEVPAAARFPRMADRWWTIRCGITRMLPFALINLLAHLKHAWVLRRLA